MSLILKALVPPKRIPYSPLHTQKHGLSLVELLLVISIFGLLASLLLPSFARAQEAARRSVCQSNLKQWGQIFKIYAGESSGGLLPPVQAYAPGVSSVFGAFSLSPCSQTVYPDYLTDLSLLSCPSDMDSPSEFANSADVADALRRHPWIAGRSYAYLGWVIDKADRPVVNAGAFPGVRLFNLLMGGNLALDGRGVSAQLAAGLDAIMRSARVTSLDAARAQAVLDHDILNVGIHPLTGETLGVGSTSTIFRLREGIERYLITDINSHGGSARAQGDIWIMFDQFGKGGNTVSHQPGGANVLYMDGHVEYVTYTHGAYDYTLNYYNDEEAVQPISPSMAKTIGAIGNLR